MPGPESLLENSHLLERSQRLEEGSRMTMAPSAGRRVQSGGSSRASLRGPGVTPASSEPPGSAQPPVTHRGACFWQGPVQPSSGSLNPPRELQRHCSLRGPAQAHHPLLGNVAKLRPGSCPPPPKKLEGSSHCPAVLHAQGWARRTPQSPPGSAFPPNDHSFSGQVLWGTVSTLTSSEFMAWDLMAGEEGAP